jgi:hypothetical protein
VRYLAAAVGKCVPRHYEIIQLQNRTIGKHNLELLR